MSRDAFGDRATFVARFGGVFEHSPWVAEDAYDAGLPVDADTADGVHRALVAAMRAAPPERRMALIAIHPDLAGKLSAAETLTESSTHEQASAGLDRLDAADRARFTALNDAYRQRFGFPFIIAARGKSKDDILAAFETRLRHGRDEEVEAALTQIEAITLMRLRVLLP